MNSSLLFRNLSHSYGNLSVLKDISFDLRPGEFVSIVGPSGCGKSTLMKLAAGLLRPQSGRLRANPNHSVIFQNATLLPWLTVTENIELSSSLGERHSGPVFDTDKLLNNVGLNDFGRFYPRQLSGGMQQRVAIARAFKRHPELILMDEPFGALDELTREKMNVILMEARERGTGLNQAAVLFITHSVTEAVFLSDRVVVLSPRPGRIETIVDIPLPRPRQAEGIRNGETFNLLVNQVRRSLKL